jgi:hypothetical protein
MKVGELVTYTEGTDPKTQEPLEFNALVLGERFTPDHLGADGEALLTLCFAKERRDAFGVAMPIHGTGQTSDLIQVRLDVAHQSHVYNTTQRAKYERATYDGGRWREHGTPVIQPERRDDRGPEYKFNGVERRGVTTADPLVKPVPGDAPQPNPVPLVPDPPPTTPAPIPPSPSPAQPTPLPSPLPKDN